MTKLTQLPAGLLHATVTFAMVVATAGCTEPHGVLERLHDRWYVAQQDESFSRPAIIGDVVYFGTGDGHIVARRMSNGSAIWSTNVGVALLGERLIAKSGVIVGSMLQNSVAVNAIDGGILWYYASPRDTVDGNTLPGQVVENRIDADSSTVYIPAWGAFVSAVDLQTGAVRWVWQPGKAATDTAVKGVFRSGAVGVRVAGDTVYAMVWHFLVRSGVTSEFWVVALEKATGQELWRLTLPCYWGGTCIEGAPAVYERLVIVNQGAHEYAIDAPTQRIAWDFPTNPVLTSISESELYGDVVYHDGGDRYLYALRAADGSLVWKAPIPSTAMRDMLVTERIVYVPNGAFLDGFDRATGRHVFGVETRSGDYGPISSPPAAAKGQIFVNVFGAAWSFDEP